MPGVSFLYFLLPPSWRFWNLCSQHTWSLSSMDLKNEWGKENTDHQEPQCACTASGTTTEGHRDLKYRSGEASWSPPSTGVHLSEIYGRRSCAAPDLQSHSWQHITAQTVRIQHTIAWVS
jgi:hypothetical protein